MGKFTVILATFTALLLLADASIYRTATTVMEENRPDACSAQIRRQQNLRDCQQYIKKESQYLTAQWGAYWEETRRELERCCEELDNLSSSCVCEGLQTAIDEQRRRGQLQGRDVRKAFQVAENVPSNCGVELETSECQFRIPRSSCF